MGVIIFTEVKKKNRCVMVNKIVSYIYYYEIVSSIYEGFPTQASVYQIKTYMR